MTIPRRLLAIFGGPPAFDEPLHVGRPNVGNQEVLHSRLSDILQRRWLTNDGPMVKEFERRICELVGVRNCVAICNATVALEIAIRAAGMSGEVIVPSYTFIATAHALQWQQITPVFCELDPDTHNIDPECVEMLITPRTTGILATHVWGRPCDVEALQRIADRHGLKLLFDAAHAFGCTHRNKMIGGFGLAEVFSFHATKFINCFEGGAVVTNDDDLAATMRLMRNFGFGGLDQVDYIGTNGKMTEVCAAMGLTSLEGIDEIVAHNRQNLDAYQKQFAELPGVQLRAYNEAECNNYQYIIVEVDECDAGISRDELVQVLFAENVLARRYFWPGCHRMPLYKSLYPSAQGCLKYTEQVSDRVIVLPTGTAVSTADIQLVCEILRTAIVSSTAVRAKLQSHTLRSP